MLSPTVKGVACVLLSVCIWAGWVVASRFAAVSHVLSPYDIAALRFGVAGIIFLPVIWRKGFGVGRFGIKGSILLSSLMGAPYMVIAIAGMRYAPASHASTIINGSLLMVTTLVGIYGLKEPTSPIRLVGVALSLAGIIGISVANPVHAPSQWIGHIFFCIAGSLWGCYTLLQRAWKVDGIHAASIVNVWAMLLYLPIYFVCFFHVSVLAHWHEIAFQAVYQGVFTSVFAFTTFNIAVILLGATRTVAFAPLVPVLATLIAIPMLHEIPGFVEWLGVAGVSAGVLLASGAIGPKRNARPLQESEKI